MKRQFRIKVKGSWHTVEVDESQRNPFQVTVDGEAMEVEVEMGTEAEPKPEPELQPKVSASNANQSAVTEPMPSVVEPPGSEGMTAITQEDQKLIRSPMPGRIVSVSVNVWDEVTRGTEICVLETMKMEQSIQALQQGIIRAVFITPGQNVSVGEPLIQLE